MALYHDDEHESVTRVHDVIWFKAYFHENIEGTHVYDLFDTQAFVLIDGMGGIWWDCVESRRCSIHPEAVKGTMIFSSSSSND